MAMKVQHAMAMVMIMVVLMVVLVSKKKTQVSICAGEDASSAVTVNRKVSNN
jgi:hypothetical protein